LGLVTDEAWGSFLEKKQGIETIKELLHQRKLSAADAAGRPELAPHVSREFHHALKDPAVTIEMLTPLDPALAQDRPVEWLRLAELDVKYEGYISRQDAQVERAERMESLIIPEDFDYDALAGISTESRQKFKKIQPRSVGQAGRISGVRTTDVAVLLMAVSKRPQETK